MPETETSRLPGFYKLSLAERIEHIAEHVGLTEDEKKVLSGTMGLHRHQADHMIENVVGVHTLPLGIATNFLINGREPLIPMVIEEPSVVAGASLAAKLARAGGGFIATADSPIMIGQIQVIDVPNVWAARVDILAHKEELLAVANQVDPTLIRLGGGAHDLSARVLEHTHAGPMLIIHLYYDVQDAMGANAVNAACEALSQTVEDLTGGNVMLRILSNLADRRLARTRVTIPENALAFKTFSGAQVAQSIMAAWAFAAADPYRAATHNKGIMNGVDAVVLATGNDWRAVEAGAHAYAARPGRYTSLSTWQRDGKGNLVGALELPLALGTVGGATRVHPSARVALKILGVESAQMLAEVVVSVGLAQNLAALRALATEGIQRGHMRLHARQVAMAAGAKGADIETVAKTLIATDKIWVEEAEAILRNLREEDNI
jgi:hydroxymethylglutaryl-CoA reductase